VNTVVNPQFHKTREFFKELSDNQLRMDSAPWIEKKAMAFIDTDKLLQ
jgi:hypothetical protein